MIAFLGFASSLVTVVSSVLGFAALLVLALIAAPIGAIVCICYGARRVFDETEFRRTQAQSLVALPT